MDALVMCGGKGTRLDAQTEKPLVKICGEPMVDRVVSALAGSQIESIYGVVSPNAPETRAYLSNLIPSIETPGSGYVTDLQVALRDEAIDTPVVTVVADLPLLTATHVDRLLSVAGGESTFQIESQTHHHERPPTHSQTPHHERPPTQSPTRHHERPPTQSPTHHQEGPQSQQRSVRSTTTVVPAALKRQLGVDDATDPGGKQGDSSGSTTDQAQPMWVPAGLNVVASAATGESSESTDGANRSDAPEERLFTTWDARVAVNVNRKRDIDVARRFCRSIESANSRQSP